MGFRGFFSKYGRNVKKYGMWQVSELPINKNSSTGHVLFFSRTKSNLAVFQQDKFQFSRTKQDKKKFCSVW